jgi:molybdenum cofactor synthesis domain-containing protein
LIGEEKTMDRKVRAGILSIKERGIPPGEDRVSQEISKMLTEAGLEVVATEVIGSEQESIEKKLIDLADRLHLDVVLTAGASGLGPKDRAPDATLAVIDREVRSIPEIMRVEIFQRKTKKAIISRAVAGIRGTTLIINLPGSPKGAKENIEVILDMLTHLVDMMYHEG